MAIGYWGYPNGQIPQSAMTPAGGVFLREDVARQARGWVNECAENGITLWFSEGYRDLATQRYWRTWWCNQGLCNNAAVPGNSNHGWAMAVDVHSGSYGNNSGSSTYRTIVAIGRKYGFQFDIPGEAWHADWNGPVSVWASDNITPVDAEELDIMGAKDEILNAIEHSRVDAVGRQDQIIIPALNSLKGLPAQLSAAVGTIQSTVRREVRARLYFDAGLKGNEYTELTAKRAVAADVRVGFVYPLHPDPQFRQGQVASLKSTPYQLIASDEKYVGLATEQFNNMLEFGNGHLRRAAVAVAEQMIAIFLATGIIAEDKEDEAIQALYQVTSVQVPKGIVATRVLPVVETGQK